MSSDNIPARIFLWAVSAVYLCAFTSLYSQVPGLYGENGLYPAAFVLEDKSSCEDKDGRCKMWSEKKQCTLNSQWMLENCAKSCNSCRSGIDKFLHFPTLLWLTPNLGLTTETAIEFLCLSGMLLSFVMLLSRSYRDCINFLILFALYYSLVQVGQIFLYYQWDNLLLEAGFLAIIIAPWNLYIGLWNIFKCKRIQAAHREHDPISFWLVKWLLFRLMFGSGIVKLLWMDKTWWDLTALNWHYESQCIPNAFAWYMAKLPTAFHRLSIVFTYLIEIVVPFLFFVPFRAVRIFAFSAQLLLQIMIMATGNYNFFNLLTVALCLSLLHSTDFRCHHNAFAICQFFRNLLKKKSKQDSVILDQCKNHQQFQDGQSNAFQPSNDKNDQPFWILLMNKALAVIKRKFQSKRLLVIEDFVRSKHFQRIMKIMKALTFASFMLIIIFIASKYFGVQFSRTEFIHSQIEFTARQFLNALPVMICVGVVLGLTSLSAEVISALGRCIIKEYSWPVKTVALLQCILFGLIGFWIFGLTLVPLSELDAKSYRAVPQIFQQQHKMTENFKIFNAYGLFRSMTGIGGRPEVIIMGADTLDKNTTWKEYNFLYKPGNLYTIPSFNIPHQPRLDWQMWFASLEDFSSNPWFINLSYKLLTGEHSVLGLMAENPFKDKPPKYIRSVLYRYHYSLNKTGFFDALLNRKPEKRWWNREYVKEYMPVVSRNDTALIKLLKRFQLFSPDRHKELHHGYIHNLLVSIRRVNYYIRAEFLIYTKFALLLLILVIQHWWKNYGFNRIKPKIETVERALRKKSLEATLKIQDS